MRAIRQATKGKLFLTGAFSLAGTSVVTGYILSAKLPVFTITVVSMGITVAVLLPIFGKKALSAIRRFTLRDWLMLLSQSVFGIFLFRMFLLFGVKHTSTVEAGILTGTTPAVTAVMAYFILKEKLTLPKGCGIAFAVSGILFLQGNSIISVSFSVSHLLGNCLVLLAACSESVFNIISRWQKRTESQASHVTIHPMVQTLLVSAITLCLSVFPAIAEAPVRSLQTLHAADWFALCWYGLFVTAIAFAFFYAGAKRCEAYTIASFSGMMPLTSMLLSLIFLHDTPTALQWIGSCLILIGMYCIGLENRRKTC